MRTTAEANSKPILKVYAEDLSHHHWRNDRDGQPIVTHGTDTMGETGLYIKQAVPDLNVPVILTGAMTPLGFEGSKSLFAARLLEPGVFVVTHSQVFPADRVRKNKDLSTFVAT